MSISCTWKSVNIRNTKSQSYTRESQYVEKTCYHRLQIMCTRKSVKIIEWVLRGINEHNTCLTRALFYWRVYTKPENSEVMYICLMGIDFVSFYDFSIRFRNCSDSVLFFWLFQLHIMCEWVIIYSKSDEKMHHF